MCQAPIEQGHETENVAATEGTDFSCKPSQLVITKSIDCKSKRSSYLGYKMCDLHLKLIDLDPIGGIIILFILPLTGKSHRNKNTIF